MDPLPIIALVLAILALLVAVYTAGINKGRRLERDLKALVAKANRENAAVSGSTKAGG